MMKEDFLHFLWKHQLFEKQGITLSGGEALQVISPGEYNPYAGADFISARLVIGSEQWAGNVEIHTRSSLWYVHHHEQDPAYNNVILHVVWEYDVEVFNAQQNLIPTLELRHWVLPSVLERYEQLQAEENRFIPCQNWIKSVGKTILTQWEQRHFRQRLEQRRGFMKELLAKSNNDWEGVLFLMLLRNFGGNVNGDTFLHAFAQLPFALVRKHTASLWQTEALFFGQLQLIPEPATDDYSQSLRAEYQYIQHKFGVQPTPFRVQYNRLRPANFPTIRLALLANLYHKEQNLFSKIIKISSFEELHALFSAVKVSDYWKTHYTFFKESSSREKTLSKAQSLSIWVNTVVPLQYAYAAHLGKNRLEQSIVAMQNTPCEVNSVLEKWQKIGLENQNAFQSQALLHAYKTDCQQKRCTNCLIGQTFLK